MKRLFIYTLAYISVFTSCAKKGTPTGGPKDEKPPVILTTNPSPRATNFEGNSIKIYFDEYVSLYNISQGLLISPPTKKPPTIKPKSSASKVIEIKFNEKLYPNTTYTMNFGNSIQDFNEGNILEGFKYVFSTGDKIDSLSIKGQVTDFLDGQLYEDSTIMLYEIDSTFSDSIVYKQKPRYITSTTDSLNFEFKYLKEGNYKIIALQDKSKNYVFNPMEDKIGFLTDTIKLDKDIILEKQIAIFKELQPFKCKGTKEISKGKIQFKFAGESSKTKIDLLTKVPENFKSFSKLFKKRNILNYWHNLHKDTIQNKNIDSLAFIVSNEKEADTIVVKLRKKEIDSLRVNTSTGGLLEIKDTLFVVTNNPMVKIDSTKFNLMKNDSIKVDFTTIKKDSHSYGILFEQEPKKSYMLEILPKAIEDIHSVTNDTLKYRFRTKEAKEYGSIKLNIENNTKHQVIIELVDYNKVERSTIVKKDKEQVIFDYLPPKTYKLKATVDNNKNNKWDTGNYLKKIQPEKIIFLEKELSLKSNWEMEEIFIIE